MSDNTSLLYARLFWYIKKEGIIKEIENFNPNQDLDKFLEKIKILQETLNQLYSTFLTKERKEEDKRKNYKLNTIPNDFFV